VQPARKLAHASPHELHALHLVEHPAVAGGRHGPSQAFATPAGRCRQSPEATQGTHPAYTTHPRTVQLGLSSGAGLNHHSSGRSPSADARPGNWVASSLAGRPTSPDVAQCSAIMLRGGVRGRHAQQDRGGGGC
jgi:hypothetical protein